VSLCGCGDTMDECDFPDCVQGIEEGVPCSNSECQNAWACKHMNSWCTRVVTGEEP